MRKHAISILCSLRPATLRPIRLSAFVLAAVSAAALAAPSASAQMRTDFGSRVNVGPRMMSPGSFGARIDPGFRATPHLDRGPVVIERGVSSTPGKPTIVKKKDTRPPDPPVRRARSGVPPSGERRYVPDEVVIEVAGQPAEATIQALSARFRLTRMESRLVGLTGSTFFRWRIPDRRSVAAVIRTLEADAVVRSAQPNYLYTTTQDTPPAAAAAEPPQYALAKLRLTEAHGRATGAQVKVAVIDSGIDTAHPELAGVVAGAFDALNSSDGPHKHGTGVAGIIAAQARLKGAAPKVQLLAVRAFATGQGSTFSIVKGLDWALAENARIVNMSFAGPSDPLLARALAAARGRGAILIAAAGNAGPKAKPLYPAADAGVIAVTATDADDKLFAMANRGRYVAVAAPGVDIVMPSPDGAYWVSTGTSMAAAYVSGVVALMLEHHPDLTAETVKKLLTATARDLGPKGRDDQFGAGLIDAYQAVTTLDAPAAPTPTAKR